MTFLSILFTLTKRTILVRNVRFRGKRKALINESETKRSIKNTHNNELKRHRNRKDIMSDRRPSPASLETSSSSINSSSRSLSSSLAPKTSNISDIRWSMIDKRRYFPLTVSNMFFVRSLLYPLTLIRTRLQVQAGKSLYTGTFNALQTIIQYEGFLALYKGFWINSFQLFPHVLYITSYEVCGITCLTFFCIFNSF